MKQFGFKKLLVAASLLGLFLPAEFPKSQVIAQGSDKLVCMPVTPEGWIANEKYKYNQIRVTNNTPKKVILWIQENLCDFEGILPSPGYRCDQYVRRSNDTISPGEAKTYSIHVPCGKIGQLDVAQDNEEVGAGNPDCYNSVDNQAWQGGIAFTVFANVCPTLAVVPTAMVAQKPSPVTSPQPSNTPIPRPSAQPTPVALRVVKELAHLPITGVGLGGIVGFGGLGLAARFLSKHFKK